MLLCTARTRPASSDTERLRALLAQDIAWDEVLRLADHHRLRPLLGRHLEAVRPLCPPASVQAALRASSHAGRLREHLLDQELLALLALLAAQGIPALPYKGPAFAAQVYGDPALRPCSDLDLLVPPGQVLRVKELLLARGYLPQQRFADAAAEAAHLHTDCEYNFSRPGNRLLVEIHWRFRPRAFPFPLEIEALWDRRQTTTLAGVSIPVLSLEDSLLLLCVHGAKHRWERLLWVCDIAEVTRALSDQQEEFQDQLWERINAQAARLGCRRILLLGLLLARNLLDAPVPEQVLKGSPDAVLALAEQVSRQLCGPLDRVPNALSRSLFHLSVRERLQDQVPYLKDRLRREAGSIRKRIEKKF